MPAFPSLPWLTNPGQQPTYPQTTPQGGFQYQDPTQGMGFIDRMQYLRQNNPEALMQLAGGIAAGDIGSGFAGAGKALQAGRQEEMGRQALNAQKNQTKAYFIANGWSEADATAAMENPAIMEAMLKQRGRNEEIEAMKAAGAYGGDNSVPKWSGNVEYGKTKDGRVIPLALDQRTGRHHRTDGGDMAEIETFISPGQIAESKAIGKGSGEAAVALPMAKVDAMKTIQLANEIYDDPKLPDMVGLINGMKPNITSEARALQSKMDQMTGQAFLNAFRSLRGGGQITESEGFKATLAILRGDVTVGLDAYKQAVTDYRGYIQSVLEAQENIADMNPDMHVGDTGTGVSPPTGTRDPRIKNVRPKN